jgi:hypothetical protein
MRKYVLLFAVLLLVVNGAYALMQLGTGKDKLVSPALLFGSTGGAVVGLVALNKRLRDLNRRDQE